MYRYFSYNKILRKEVKICQDLELAVVDIVLLAGIQVVVLEADIMLADQVVLQEAHLLTEVPLCIIIIILHHLLEEVIMDIEEMFILVLQVV